MLGLDTYILKQVTKWIEKGKTDEEIISRARIFMGSVLAIHLLLAIIAGWCLYKVTKSKEKPVSGLITPIILAFISLIIPYGTEMGEELTNVPSSGLIVFATLLLSVITIIIWFTKKNPEETQKKEEIL